MYMALEPGERLRVKVYWFGIQCGNENDDSVVVIE